MKKTKRTLPGASLRGGIPVTRASRGGNFAVVGIGASAGGIEPLIELMKCLPKDCGMAVVVLMHLDPKHKTSLNEILARSTTLPVRMIDGGEKVEPNEIYILPPDREVAIEDGKLQLAARKKSDGLYLVIDSFLASLGRDMGNRAAAVILSGSGADGSLGIKEVKAQGGVTFAQDPKTAAFSSMPSMAAQSGAVDFILPPDQIAHELVRIAKHLTAPRRGDAGRDLGGGNTEGDLAKLFSLLRALHGVDFSYYKPTTLRRRVSRRMILRKASSLHEYVALLQQNPAEVDALFQDLLINVTSFFRDPEVFRGLRKKVFPRLLKTQQGTSFIRVWVPGCSTGEEVYSLAIALLEFLGKQAMTKPVQFFGTDISEAVLARARSGIYSEAVATQLPPDYLRRYFLKTDRGYQIAKFVRDCCVFARQNVAEDPPFSKIDLISCRNVLIYLGPMLQKKIMPIFHYALKSGGALLLGGSETIGGFADLFTLSDKKNKIYVKRGDRTGPLMQFVPRAAAASGEEQPAAKAPTEDFALMDLQRRVDHIVLTHYAPAGVVINRNMEVLQFRGQTGLYIEHSPGEASLNLMKMARHDLLVDIRTALSRAMKSDTAIRKNGIHFQHAGKPRVVNIEIIPFHAGASAEHFFIVLFEDVPVAETTAVVRGGGKARSVSPGAERENTRLREELESTKESLQAFIEEQEATNEELKSANEEIQSSNEELQSTNEELETAKEELQSTNEELTTLNEELQTRNSELSQLNNDLGNLLSSVSMPILMLGNDLTIRRFTPMAERFFNLIQGDVGRRVTDINPNVIIPNLEKLVSEVIETLHIQEHEVQDREGRWYSLRIRPYRTADNKIDGAVIMLVDIDEIKLALDELTSVMLQPVVTLSSDLTVIRANTAFYKFFGNERDATQSHNFYEVCGGKFNVPALKNLIEGVLPEKRRVDHHRIDGIASRSGQAPLYVSARRIFYPSKGTNVTLLAFEDGPNTPV